MASNFKIFLMRKYDMLHLHLSGIFDGSSALELINMLKSVDGKTDKIVVNTHALSMIHPFGLEVFQLRFCGNKLQSDFIFTAYIDNSCIIDCH